MATTSSGLSENQSVSEVVMKKDCQSVLRLIAASVFLFGPALSARAQNPPGVTEKAIVIGSCSALEGPSHSLGIETVNGANAYFSLINEEGGVNGRKLKLIAYDDSYDPAKTETCFNRLMSDNVFAL
jgi:branched-chain amino acid transport system substrate-binding protein